MTSRPTKETMLAWHRVAQMVGNDAAQISAYVKKLEAIEEAARKLMAEITDWGFHYQHMSDALAELTE